MIVKFKNKNLEYIVEKDDAIFCPGCGVKEVYVEIGEGDYYEGPHHYCKNCNTSFTLPSCGVDENIEFKEQ